MVICPTLWLLSLLPVSIWSDVSDSSDAFSSNFVGSMITRSLYRSWNKFWIGFWIEKYYRKIILITTHFWWSLLNSWAFAADSSMIPISHFLYMFLDGKKTTRSQFSVPGLREIHRNLKQEKKFDSRESFFRKSPFSTFSCISPGFGGPWDKLWIFFHLER